MSPHTEAQSLLEANLEAEARGMSAGSPEWASFIVQRMKFVAPSPAYKLPDNTRIRRIYASHPDPVDFAKVVFKVSGGGP